MSKNAIEFVNLSDVMPEEIPWLWEDWLVRGGLCLLPGEPGIGKSSVCLDLVSRLTAGRDWPDGKPCPRGRALYLSREDSLEYTLARKLQLFGADLARVVSCNADAVQGGFRLDRDCGWLEREVREKQIDLVVIDPFDGFLGNLNPNNAADVRTATNPLSEMAIRASCSVILVHHFNKNEQAARVNRSAGSVDLIAAARTSIHVERDVIDSSQNIFQVVKSNVSAFPRPLLYRFADDGRIEWTAPGADFEFQQRLQKLEGVVREAVEVLKTILDEHDGEVRSTVATEALREAGISTYASGKARRMLGVSVRRRGGQSGHWVWVCEEKKAA